MTPEGSLENKWGNLWHPENQNVGWQGFAMIGARRCIRCHGPDVMIQPLFKKTWTHIISYLHCGSIHMGVFENWKYSARNSCSRCSSSCSPINLFFYGVSCPIRPISSLLSSFRARSQSCLGSASFWPPLLPIRSIPWVAAAKRVPPRSPAALLQCCCRGHRKCRTSKCCWGLGWNSAWATWRWVGGSKFVDELTCFFLLEGFITTVILVVWPMKIKRMWYYII